MKKKQQKTTEEMTREERHEIVTVGVMELARRQFAALENTRRTTAIVLADYYDNQQIPRGDLLAGMEEVVCDLIYGDGFNDATVMALQLKEKAEEWIDRYQKKFGSVEEKK